MANGIVGARARLAANVETSLYTVPAATGATVNVNFANHGPNAAIVKLAITAGAAPAEGDWIEAGVTLAAGQTLLRTQEPLATGEVVYAVADQATVDVRVSGYQEDM